jgi:hypothetical protein
MVDSKCKKIIYLFFGLLELEMADLRCFLKKRRLYPLGVS